MMADSHLRLLPASRWIRRSVNCTLDMSCNAILAGIKLAANDAVFAQRSANRLTNLSNGTVGVELLSDRAG
jgi:hypothetical protein